MLGHLWESRRPRCPETRAGKEPSVCLLSCGSLGWQQAPEALSPAHHVELGLKVWMPASFLQLAHSCPGNGSFCSSSSLESTSTFLCPHILLEWSVLAAQRLLDPSSGLAVCVGGNKWALGKPGEATTSHIKCSLSTKPL